MFATTSEPKTRTPARLGNATAYAIAIAAVVGFGLFQWFLIQTFSVRLVFLLFFPAIMISAWFGGWRSGLGAVLLAAPVARYFFLEPYFAFWPLKEPTQCWTLVIFVAEGLFISALGEARLRSRSALLEERNLLEERVILRTREISMANEQLAAQIAERERAQLALSESESKFRSVVETASDAIVMSNAAGDIVSWNRGAQEMFGYAAEEILREPVTRLIPNDCRPAYAAAMARLQAAAAPRLPGRPLELRGRRKDGTEFPLELSLAGWAMDSSEFYSAIIRDLTQRKQAEADRILLVEEMAARAELEAAESRYRQLAEAVPQIVWTTLPDGSVDYFNQHWFNYTGLGSAESLGWNWQHVLHPDDIAHTLDVWTRSVRTGSDYEIEYRFRRHDGTYRWHLARGAPLRDDTGRIFKWLGSCTDIDARKGAEESSRFMAQAMALLTASLNEESIVRTLAGLCAPALGNWCTVDLIEMTSESLSTEGARPLLALRRAATAGGKVKGGPAPLFIAPEKAATPGPWRALERQRPEIVRGDDIAPLTVGGGILESCREMLIDGQELRYAGSAVLCVPLIARGHTLGVLTIIVADAAHSLGEADISSLDGLARNGALMVDNARLLRETQEANRAKDEFLAVLSHELRTPLTAILGWVQLLSSSTLDADTHRRALETIERNTHAQVQLIEDLLDLSRIITGKLRLDIQPVALAPIVEAALDAIRPAAQAKDIGLHTALAKENCLVMGDAHRLQQVLWNLLSNAVKFTPRGGHITAALGRLGSHIEISVQDSGRGISADFLPYVFDRFRQADSSSTRQHGGLGLGLAIVRHLTELHGGTAHAESGGEGQGTTFKIVLPISPLTHNGEIPLVPEGANGNSVPEAPLVLSGVRVLLVDDEHDTREVLSAALRRYGAQVQTCSTAQEALSALAMWRPGVLVSDIGMPHEDGYELIRKVRELTLEAGGGVPAVALTAYARSSDLERALDAGFNRHLVKPIDPVKLASQVAALARG